MATQLRVVNDCLAIMGEAPLGSLVEDHPYKSAILSKLDAENIRIQTAGWWFNTEGATLTADTNDNRIYLPNDTATVLIFDQRPGVIQRGRVLYDLHRGTDVFPAGTSFNARLIRVVPLEDTPTLAAEYIAAEVLVWFQSQYDGDQTKTRNLMADRDSKKLDAKAEHIRNRNVNLFDTNGRLARIRYTINDARLYRGRLIV